MHRQLQSVCALLVTMCLAGCASGRPPPPKPPPFSSIPPTRCAPGTPCAPKEASPLRQYYDVRHRRYYYYDPKTQAYYWEDGQPKL